VIGTKPVNIDAVRDALTAAYGPLAHCVYLREGGNKIRAIFQQRDAHTKCLANRRLEVGGSVFIVQAFSLQETRLYSSSVHVQGFPHKPELLTTHFAQFGPITDLKARVCGNFRFHYTRSLDPAFL
jgi:hypothetical protein